MTGLKIAAAYIRVSTDDQTEYSPAAQLHELRSYASSHGMLLDERYIYADEGISGRKAEKRPAFMKMVSDAKSPEHPFNVILVHKFDRFARSREDSIVYKSMLRRAGVDVISIKEPLAEGNYSGVMEAIYESFAEAYSINLGQEVKKGMTEKARRGEAQTIPPFGYRMADHRFVPDELEAPVVQEIFRRFGNGEIGYSSMAKELNERGYTTHRGNRFENRTVEYILHNPVYIGKIRWNPSGRTRRNYDDPNLMVTDGVHTPLIDIETWTRVQARAAELKTIWRYHGRPSYDRKHWLCGIVRCAACGTTLVWSKPRYLKCNNYAAGRCTHSQHIAASLLEDAVIRQMRADLVNPDVMRCKIMQSSDGAGSEIAKLRQALQQAEHRRDRLTEAYLSGALELCEYTKLKASINDAVKSAADALEAAQSATAKIDTAAILQAAIERSLATITSDRSIAEKYDAANSLIDSCTFDKAASQLDITYRISI